MLQRDDMSKRKKKKFFGRNKYKPEDAPEQTFTAFIILGNRQVVRREVVASKRFRCEEETYTIKPECIFLKNIDGVVRSVSIYREGNPNPYDFKTDNVGLSATELDRIFAEDFYHIVTNLQPENKMRYIFVVTLVGFIISIAYIIVIALRVFVLKQ